MRAALGVAVVLAALAAVALLAAARVLVVADPLPPRADAIVILAGSVPDRVLEAADLYRAGLAPRVIVTRERLPRGQAALRARGVRLPEGDELTVTALRGLGVPPGAIVVLRRRGVSTESEARTIARWACARRFRRLIVVTSRAHSRRARLILRHALGEGIALALRPSRYDAFAPARWWHVRRDAKLILSEYEKLANYWLIESWTIPPCGGLRHSGGRLRRFVRAGVGPPSERLWAGTLARSGTRSEAERAAPRPPAAALASVSPRRPPAAAARAPRAHASRARRRTRR